MSADVPTSSTVSAHDALRREARRFALASRQLGMSDDEVISAMNDALLSLPDEADGSGPGD